MSRSTSQTEAKVTLTPQEKRILCAVVQGKCSAEVAAEMYLSKRTVDFHLNNIHGKLGATSRIQAIRRAVALGLLPADCMAW